MEPTNVAATFTVEQLAIWVTVVSTTVGLIVAFGKFVRESIQVRWDNRHQNDSVGVELKKVAVSERDAQTHEMTAIFEGFTLSLAAVSQRAQNAETSAAAAHDRATKAEEKAEASEKRADEQDKRIDQVQRERSILVDHIIALEKMVPNPPGPPTRPLPLD